MTLALRLVAQDARVHEVAPDIVLAYQRGLAMQCGLDLAALTTQIPRADSHHRCRLTRCATVQREQYAAEREEVARIGHADPDTQRVQVLAIYEKSTKAGGCGHPPRDPSKMRLPATHTLRFLPLALTLLSGLGCSEAPAPELVEWTAPANGWAEVWRDDFDGPAQSAPDASRWNIEVNELGYNDELNYNTADRKNSFVDGGGNLVLQALQESYLDANGVRSVQPYTSARLNTQGKVEQVYGKFEARIRLPAGGRGIWPAFWMLGSNIDDPAVGWPECGEVDILEWRGSEPWKIISSLHGPNYSGGNSYNESYTLPEGSYGDFHTYTFEWTADGVRWLVDGNQLYVKTAQSVRDHGQRWVYDHPFFIILNLAVGGIFDGDPIASTTFPQQMAVDYVSVSQLRAP
jgi:beta-glucanase (GH16 family)